MKIIISLIILLIGFTIPHIAYADRCNSTNILGAWKSINLKSSIKINIIPGGDITCSTCKDDMDTPLAWELTRDNRWKYANYYDLFFYGTLSGKYKTLCEISRNGKIMTLFLNRLRVNFMRVISTSNLSPVEKPLITPKNYLGKWCRDKNDYMIVSKTKFETVDEYWLRKGKGHVCDIKYVTNTSNQTKFRIACLLSGRVFHYDYMFNYNGENQIFLNVKRANEAGRGMFEGVYNKCN